MANQEIHSLVPTLNDNLNTLTNNFNELNTRLINAVYYYKNIGGSYTTYIEKLNAVLSQSDLPTEKFILGCILSGSYHTLCGFIDTNKSGFMLFGNYAGGGMFKLYNGEVTAV